MATESSGDLPLATAPAPVGEAGTEEKPGDDWRIPQAGPLREEEVEHAVKFLSHPKVKGSPVVYRRSFLERKGLSREEIDEAFRRHPDPPSNSSPVTPPKEGIAGTASAPLRPNAQEGPAEQPAAGQSTTSNSGWTQMLVALGVLTATGAGAGVLTKKYFIPMLRNWILDISKTSTSIDTSNIAQGNPREEPSSAMASVAAISTLANQMAATMQEMTNSKFAERQQLDRIIRAVEAQTQELRNTVVGVREVVLNAKDAKFTRSVTNSFPSNGAPSPDAWTGQTTANGLRFPYFPASGNQAAAKPTNLEAVSDPLIDFGSHEQRGNADCQASGGAARRVPHSLSYLDPRSATSSKSPAEEPSES